MDNEIVKENHKRNCKIVMNFTRIREHEHEIYILKNKNEDLCKNIRELKQKNNIIEKKRKKLNSGFILAFFKLYYPTVVYQRQC